MKLDGKYIVNAWRNHQRPGTVHDLDHDEALLLMKHGVALPADADGKPSATLDEVRDALPRLERLAQRGKIVVPIEAVVTVRVKKPEHDEPGDGIEKTAIDVPADGVEREHALEGSPKAEAPPETKPE